MANMAVPATYHGCLLIGAAVTRLVVNNHGLAQLMSHVLTEGSGHDIADAAGGKRQHECDGLAGKGLCRAEAADRQAAQAQGRLQKSSTMQHWQPAHSIEAPLALTRGPHLVIPTA
jgi:hypothetical protein